MTILCGVAFFSCFLSMCVYFANTQD
jgi:hypothetical protein